MSNPWTEEIVWTQSEDDILLDGAVIRPTAGTKSVAIVHVHGFTGRFSHRIHIELGRELAVHGYVSVTGNTRGYGFGDNVRRGVDGKMNGEPVMIGGGWELF